MKTEITTKRLEEIGFFDQTGGCGGSEGSTLYYKRFHPKIEILQCESGNKWCLTDFSEYFFSMEDIEMYSLKKFGVGLIKKPKQTMETLQTQIENKWNSLTPMQKRSYGDWFITTETDLNTWNKPFKDLSELKKYRVSKFIMQTSVESLNNLIS